MFLIYWMDNLTSVSLEPCKEKKFNNLLLRLEMKTHTRIARRKYAKAVIVDLRSA